MFSAGGSPARMDRLDLWGFAGAGRGGLGEHRPPLGAWALEGAAKGGLWRGAVGIGIP